MHNWKNDLQRWKHDKECCTFLGHFKQGACDCDLWGCDRQKPGWPIFMARYSDEPSDYTCNESSNCTLPEFEAKRRWEEIHK
jgi:hypothetical protein